LSGDRIGRLAGGGLALCAISACVACATPAPAGPPPSPASADPGPPELQTPPVVVGAVEPGTLPEDPTAFTTVVEMDEYAGEARTVPEIVGDTVGVQVRSFGGPGDPSEISIRGSSPNQVVVLLDGVRLNTAQSGAVDLSTIPRDLLERIEISRGGGSVQTGSDAIGGVVNLVTRSPSGRPSTAATFTGGSWSTYEGSLVQTGPLAGFEVAAGYQGFGTDGDWRFQAAEREVDGVPLPSPQGTFTRVNNDRQAHSALLRVARDTGDFGRLRLNEFFSHQSGGVPGPDSGGGELLGQSLTARSRGTRNVADLAYELADVTPLGLSGDVRLFHRYDRRRFEDEEPRLGAPVDSDDRNQSLGGRLDARRSVPLGPSEHLASLGLELREDWLASSDFGDFDRRVAGVFAQDEVRLLDGQLRLVPALRYDATQGFGGEWMPRFGALLLPLPWLRLRANVERSYRVPNFDELYFDEEFVRGDPNLEPEDAIDADLGFGLGLDRAGPLRGVWLEAAGFYRDIKNSIVFQQLSPFVLVATNTGAATVWGVELAGGLRALGWVGFTGNWTRLDTEVERTGLPLPGRAQSEYLLRLDVGPDDGAIRIWGQRRFTGEIPVTFDGGTRVGARAVYDVGLVLDLSRVALLRGWVPGTSLLSSVTATNVTDQSVRDAKFFPQPGRTLSFRVEWRQ